MNTQELLSAAERFGTPLYVYDGDAIRQRVALLKDLFEGRFEISYAIKANPAQGLLDWLMPVLDRFDASSGAEVLRALKAGMSADRVTFSGPAKKPVELRLAVDSRIGDLVLESLEEAREVSAIAVEAGVEQACVLRINPIRIPRKFGASMAGTASQFGVDEEDIASAIPEIAALPGIRLEGFHIYSGTNCLDAEAIAENFSIFAGIFKTAADLAGSPMSRLIFGSGMGVPYLPDEAPLDHEKLPPLVLPILDDLRAHPLLADAQPVLEMGRWLAAPFGWLLTGVVRAKHSRGKDIRACDAGFNNHLAACGMMGSVFRRNWRFENLSNASGKVGEYTLVGPLCTTIDRLAADLEIAEPRVGDIVAIPQSGAYGLTSSPSRFISHPEPREVLRCNGALEDISESLLNRHPGQNIDG